MKLFILNFRNNEVGSGIKPGALERYDVDGKLAEEGNSAGDSLRQASRVVFVTHGYNVNAEEGRVGLRNFASFLELSEDDAVVLVLWPGDKRILSTLSYPLQGNNADETARHLVLFIAERNIIQKDTQLSFITHSLGARVGMETVKRMLSKRGYNFEQVCLMAPALVDYSLSNAKEYQEATDSCGRVAVLASRMDLVLAGAFPLGNLLEVFPLMRKRTVGLALGWHGPRNHRSGKVPDNVFHEQISVSNGVGHGDYIPEEPAQKRPEHSRGEEAAQFASGVVNHKVKPEYWF